MKATERSDGSQTVTVEHMDAAKTRNGGWSKQTLIAWGVPWPPPRGWREVLLKGGDFGPLVEDRERRKAKRKARKAKKRAENKARKPAKATPTKVKSIRPECKTPTTAEKADFYASWEWQTLRMKTLKRYGRRCLCCGAAPGEFTVAGEPVRLNVDHIKPISKHWSLRLDPENVQVLCAECNKGKGAWDQTDWREGVA